MKKTAHIKAGMLIAIEAGAYSDHSVLAFIRALKDFDTGETLEKYLDEHPKQREDYSGDEYEFVAWLSANDYIEDIDYMRWHIGSYRTFENSPLVEPFRKTLAKIKAGG